MTGQAVAAAAAAPPPGLISADGMAPDRALQYYNALINASLKPRLEAVLQRRNALYADMAEFHQLQAQMETLEKARAAEPAASGAADGAPTATDAAAAAAAAAQPAASSLPPSSPSTKKTVAPLLTRVDLGCDFYATASIPRPDRITVNIGADLWVEMDFAEAAVFIKEKVAGLEERALLATDEANEIKAHITFVLESIAQIAAEAGEDVAALGLPVPPARPRNEQR